MSPLTPVRAPELSQISSIRHGFFTRTGGVSSGIYSGLNAGLGSNDVQADIIENRNRIAKWLGESVGDLASPYQVHSSDVVIAQSAWLEKRPKADGLVTDKPGLILGIVTADCGPVLFADDTAKLLELVMLGGKARCAE